MLLFSGILAIQLDAQQQKVDSSVKEIILVFKTHFDIGYTDYAEAVVQKYSTTMPPCSGGMGPASGASSGVRESGHGGAP